MTLPGEYRRTQGMIADSSIALIVGSGVDSATPQLLDFFAIRPEAMAPETRGLTDQALILLQGVFPYHESEIESAITGEPLMQVRALPGVITLYGLAMLRAQIDAYMETRPDEIKTRFAAAYDQELLMRRQFGRYDQ